jgi:glyoxylase-like metal-dependent hydrolase (beta-lactamase superfamily II)
MAHQIPLTPESIADLPHPDDHTREIGTDLAYQRLAMVNVVFFGLPLCGDLKWVLIDAGVTGMTGRIERAARERFGEGARPAAIILTHEHFDHVGCLEKLADKWDAPIYADELEAPYPMEPQPPRLRTRRSAAESCRCCRHSFRAARSM